MAPIADNIKRFRQLKGLSQKEVALAIDIAQGQYSLIENGKVVPTIPTLEKIAKVFEVELAELIREMNKNEEEINLSILEKVKLIDQLDSDEKNCLLKMIDIAIAKKRMKDNLSSLISS